MSTQSMAYSLNTIGQATNATLIPVSRGVAAVDGEVAELVAVSDNPFPYGKKDNDLPNYPQGMGPLVGKYLAFLDNCQHRVYNLKAYGIPLVEPSVVRGLPKITSKPFWLDRQPYQVLLAAGDKLVGIHYEDVAYVLIVRGEKVMAGVMEPTIPHWIRDAGHCDDPVIDFERNLESDPSQHANALQHAFDYAGRIHDRSSDDGKIKAGKLVEQLSPIFHHYEGVALGKVAEKK